MDQILERFRAIPWHYAPQDDAARRELHDRIAIAGRQRDQITYSELVRGVLFTLPSLREPAHRIDPNDWQDLDRAIVGDFLGYISMESYEEAQFIASALVVSKEDRRPGKGFFQLLKDVGLIADLRSSRADLVWAEQTAKAHDWYCAEGPTA